MTPPPHALTLWLSQDTIIVQYPDGQQIPIPSHEPARILSVLRSQQDRHNTRPNPDKWLVAKNFHRAFTDSDAKEHGAKLRAREEERKEREKKARMKRIEKRDRLKAANELLELVGL